MLGVLTLAFFFQDYLARSARAVAIFRYTFLTVTLVWLYTEILRLLSYFNNN